MAYRQGSRRPVYEHRYELEESKGRIDDFVYVLAWLLTMTVNGLIHKHFNAIRAQNELESNCLITSDQLHRSI